MVAENGCRSLPASSKLRYILRKLRWALRKADENRRRKDREGQSLRCAFIINTTWWQFLGSGLFRGLSKGLKSEIARK